jgi:hypothetical protein
MNARRQRARSCPDCTTDSARRDFLKAAVGGTAGLIGLSQLQAAPTPKSHAETLIAAFFKTLTPGQKSKVAFAWDHQDPKRGLLRTRVSANWHITSPTIASGFFSKDQQGMLADIFKGMFQPEWHAKLLKQLKDDTGGKPWGADQNIAIFGEPGSAASGPASGAGAGKFEFVMTGRHLTCRADGNSQEHVALGGPIFHGHAPKDDEEKDHPGNVFWFQGLEANKVWSMLDGKQRKVALVEKTPDESSVQFHGDEGEFPGLAVKEMSGDQKAQVKATLDALIQPYRDEDRKEILSCLEKRGGLDKCALSFYADHDTGKDGVWDNWRLEGPSFVWYFRGNPHVHIWINVADDPKVELNA